MKKFFLFLILALPKICCGQEGYSLWNSAEIEKKWNKKWSTNLQFQTRHVENLNYLQTYFWDVSMGYKVAKNLEIAVNYRNITRRKAENKDWKKRDRYYADLSYANKLSKIKWGNRLRYQHQFKDNDGANEFDASYLRYKTQIALASKSKWVPYASADFFYLLQTQKIDQVRPKIGLDLEFNKHQEIGIGIQKDIATVPGTTNGPLTISIGYGFKF